MKRPIIGIALLLAGIICSNLAGIGNDGIYQIVMFVLSALFGVSGLGLVLSAYPEQDNEDNDEK